MHQNLFVSLPKDVAVLPRRVFGHDGTYNYAEVNIFLSKMTVVIGGKNLQHDSLIEKRDRRHVCAYVCVNIRRPPCTVIPIWQSTDYIITHSEYNNDD